MLVLFETAAGFAVFKMLKEKVLKDVDNIPKYFASAESASQTVQLAGFHKFQNSAEALAAAVAINEGKALKPLRSVLKKAFKNEVQKKLLILDAKLGSSLKEKLPELEILCNTKVTELIRCIRGQVDSLIPGLTNNEASAMMLGLGHNLARYKLKFSPDKVDTMVVQAVNLLDDLDKELNNYVMRLKEWYGWHFPEMAKILLENSAYVHTVKTMGLRTNARTTDFSAILDTELAERIKEAAEVSMGCEITPDDILFMQELADQIIELTDYRAHLADYLTRRMTCLAPNVTIMLGELIGARLIAHSGSLINLAKNASSTVQLIGAEKALFRALKTKKATPKYGLIYHAELVNRAPTECKGKMSRMLAAKTSLAARVDALSEETSTKLGEDSRVKLLKQINFMSARKSFQLSGRAKHQAHLKPHFSDRSGAENNYPASQDTTITGVRRERTDDQTEQPTAKRPKIETQEPMASYGESNKKKKKNKDTSMAEAGREEDESMVVGETNGEASGETKKKKKKKKNRDTSLTEGEQESMIVEESEETFGERKKKKKNRNTSLAEGEQNESAVVGEASGETPGQKKKKKKNRDSSVAEGESSVMGEENGEIHGQKKKKKKNRDSNITEGESSVIGEASGETSGEKKKKKKRDREVADSDEE